MLPELASNETLQNWSVDTLIGAARLQNKPTASLLYDHRQLSRPGLGGKYGVIAIIPDP